MRNAIATLLLGSMIAASAVPAVAAPPRPAAKVSAAPVQLGTRFSSADLDRITVGNQAGILKIYSRSRTVVFIKEAPGTDMVGVDGTQWAPLSDRSREAILASLEIRPEEAASVGRNIMSRYRQIKQSRTAIALLGVIGSLPGNGASAEIRQFLSGLLVSQKDVVVRRQAVLALALCDRTDETTVRGVIRFMSASRNAWESFTTRQFFEYHKDEIRAMDPELKRLLAASGNPYAADILSVLH